MALKIFTIIILSLHFLSAHGNVQRRHVLLNLQAGQNNDVGKSVDAVQGPLIAAVSPVTPVGLFEGKAKRMRGALSALARKVHLKKAIVSPEEEKIESADLFATIVAYVISVLIWVVLFILVAYLYHQNWGMNDVDLNTVEEEGDFKSAFLCHEEPKQACWACLCGGIRWADAQSAAGIYGFWVGIAIWLCVAMLDAVTNWGSWVLVALLFTYFRNNLRKKLKMKNEWSDTMCDCALWCCCLCCAIFQEARHVEELSSKDKEKGEPATQEESAAQAEY